MTVSEGITEMMMAKKSYWQGVYVGGNSAKTAVKSWFEPLCEGMTPYKAEILCDIETDREKKMRAFMTDEQGAKFQFERTTGQKFSVSRKQIEPAQPVAGTTVASAKP